jgi:hypothetical protein
VILHCEGHYTGPVSTEISSHFLPQDFFLAFGVALHCYESYISGIFCMSLILEHRCTKQIGAFRQPHTISSPISSRSHDFGTGRHTSYNKILCRSVQIDVRKRRCLTEGGVATTEAQLLAQVMASDVSRPLENTVCCYFGRKNVDLSSGHFLGHHFNIHKFYVLPTQCIYVFVRISEQTAIISLYSIN